MFSPFSFFDAIVPMHYHAPSEPHYRARVVEGGVEIEVEVPRFRPDDIKIEVDSDHNRIVISGQRHDSAARDHFSSRALSTFYSSGSSMPSFRYAFNVPASRYELSKTSHTLEHGVLTVHVPERADAKKIEDQPQSPKVKTHQVAIARSNSSNTSSSNNNSNAVATSSPQQLQQTVQWPPRFRFTHSGNDQQRGNTDEAFTFEVELPDGVNADDVKLQLTDDGTLSVHVSYKARRESAHGFSEHSASFMRAFSVPSGTTMDKIRAKIEGNKLVVEVVKA